MTRTAAHRVALIEQMNAEWRSLGRSPTAIRSLQAAAAGDPGLECLVLGDGIAGPICPTPHHFVEHMRQASGRAERDEAARLFGVLLRESINDEMLGRMLVQLLLPGLVSVAGRLQWGRGGDWRDGEEFFGELVTTSWLVVKEWAGQDRSYAVLDLLSAIRCRVRRQLLRAKEVRQRTEMLDAGWAEQRRDQPECHRQELALVLLELHGEGLGRAETQVLYARHLLGDGVMGGGVRHGHRPRARSAAGRAREASSAVPVIRANP